MEILKSNSVIKKILIIFIIIIMTFNFIIPNYAFATSEELDESSIGGKLVSGIFALLAYLGDAGLGLMQNLMIGTSDLRSGDQWAIKYSPGIIFSNQVLPLDINFINPDDQTLQRTTQTTDIQTTETELNVSDFILESVATGGEFEGQIDTYLTGKGYLDRYNNASSDGKSKNYEDNVGSTSARSLYISVVYYWKEFINGQEITCSMKFQYNNGVNMTTYESYIESTLTLSESSNVVVATGGTISSTANALQDNIAKWYIALRTLALVGLLSVLLYLGIRIVLSSASAQNKAKYKNMLKDWLVAVCLLFVLHYVMAFMLDFVDKLNSMLGANLGEVTAEGYQIDDIMNTVRKNVILNFQVGNGGVTAGYTIMYLALVILTGVFTFQYLKRVVYMAFLTMIAPLIALTYPLDKVKDSKAQAFSFWLKEYIVNCLIQPVHLLLYIVLIKSAIGFATDNILYSIVALAFMMPAEKLIKQMFGLKSDSSVNTLTAAAGGAMVMNMLNKIKGGGGAKAAKGGSGSSGSNGEEAKPVRTATRNPNVSGESANMGTENTGAESGPNVANRNSTVPLQAAPSSSTALANNSSSSGAGLSALAKKYGPGIVKGIGRGALKGTAGLAGASIGLAAAIADGGDGLAAKVGGGALAGSHLASNAMTLPGRFKQGVSNIKETYQKGEMGEEAYNNQKFDKEFYKSDGYKKILSSSALRSQNLTPEEIQARTQTFLDNGITDAKAIKTALEAGIDNGDEYKTISDMGITDVKKYSRLKTSKNLSGTAIASRMAIAKNMPGELYGNEIAFIRYAGRYGISEDEARGLFSEINDYV